LAPKSIAYKESVRTVIGHFTAIRFFFVVSKTCNLAAKWLRKLYFGLLGIKPVQGDIP